MLKVNVYTNIQFSEKKNPTPFFINSTINHSIKRDGINQLI